jgi:signal transduction histidine kinase
LEIAHSIMIKAKNAILQKRLRAKVIVVLQKKRDLILDQHHDAYCQHISTIDAKRRGIDYLKKACMPVRARFSVILDRFIEVLKNENEEYSYNLSESERDIEYALRFVVPGQHRNLDFHDIVEMTESFVDIAARNLLDGTDPMLKAHKQDVMIILSKLIYIVFEDLWVSSVVGFRSQHELIQQLLLKLMRAHEEERQNFWRDLHDDFLQVLAITALKLEIIEELSRKNTQVMKEELEFLKKLIKGSAERLRNLCQGFNLSWFERKGLVFSLRAFVKLFEEEFKIPIMLNTHANGKKIAGFRGVTLLRIIQEALHNIGKHSKASRGEVDIKVLAKEVLVTIEDDGVGFDVRRASRGNASFTHFGLVFMKERVRLLNGSLKIGSMKSRGTRILIRIPLEKGDFSRKSVVENPEVN